MSEQNQHQFRTLDEALHHISYLNSDLDKEQLRNLRYERTIKLLKADLYEAHRLVPWLEYALNSKNMVLQCEIDCNADDMPF